MGMPGPAAPPGESEGPLGPVGAAGNSRPIDRYPDQFEPIASPAGRPRNVASRTVVEPEVELGDLRRRPGKVAETDPARAGPQVDEARPALALPPVGEALEVKRL